MDININVHIDLPPGWEFDGLWYEHYDDPPAWTADVRYVVPSEQENKRGKALFEVNGHGPTPEAAIADIPRAVAEGIAAITATENWAKQLPMPPRGSSDTDI